MPAGATQHQGGPGQRGERHAWRVRSVNRPTPLYASLFLVFATLPALGAAYGGADAADRAACREQALAEGLRSEEVILDYIVHECLPARSASQPPAGAVPGAAKAMLPTPRPGSAARLN